MKDALSTIMGLLFTSQPPKQLEGKCFLEMVRVDHSRALGLDLNFVSLLSGREATAESVFRNMAGDHELKQVIRSSRLGSDAGELKPAERMSLHQCSGTTPVDIEIPHSEFLSGLFDVLRASGKQSPRQAIVGTVGHFEGLVKIPDSDHG